MRETQRENENVFGKERGTVKMERKSERRGRN